MKEWSECKILLTNGISKKSGRFDNADLSWRVLIVMVSTDGCRESGSSYKFPIEITKKKREPCSIMYVE